jgi:uncharacterized protein YmfQ (DUF2313 family)
VVVEALRLRYAAQGAKLLPPGPAWTRAEGTVLRKLLEGLAGLVGDVHERGLDLLDEADPRTTLELLPEWEAFLALPEPFQTLEPTVVLRRAAVLAKLTGVGGQTIAAFVALAQSLGYPITVEEIEEFAPARIGDTIGARTWGAAWAFAWLVHAPQATPTFFRADESTAGEPLVAFGNELLEAAFERAKPAHTEVLFAYDQPWLGYAPWTDHTPPAAVFEIVAPTVTRTIP